MPIYKPSHTVHNSFLLNSLVFLLMLLRVQYITLCEADATSDTEIIKKLLGKGYDWRVRPPGINLTVKEAVFPTSLPAFLMSALRLQVPRFILKIRSKFDFLPAEHGIHL
ncbi:hypothetical protein COOONC_07997 [Cooperia oncophora]